jgi:SAM-dependent methyltransferase
MEAIMKSDAENLLLVESPASVDATNRTFYSRFPYPSPPMTFPVLSDPAWETVMLNQSAGCFEHPPVPVNATIWVAGCGTNQAIFTALRFPKATVIGSDVSTGSLAVAARTARALGIDNLTLREESLNEVGYRAEFDYIVNTGVIHHNADPQPVLARIARALKPDGLLELMVYNRFHRTGTTAFQKAVRLVSRANGAEPSFDEELEIARQLGSTEPLASRPEVARLLRSRDPEVADSLIQPVEYSYTVGSLDDLVTSCGLELTLPCYCPFDFAGRRLWTLRFSTEALQQRVEALPETVRWQLINLLLLGDSPMLWFFVRHRRGHAAAHEARANQAFLDHRFVAATTTRRNYVRNPSDFNYRLAEWSTPHPPKPPDPILQAVVDASQGDRPMHEVLHAIGVDAADRKAVTDLRMHTTTSMCPYLKAV